MIGLGAKKQILVVGNDGIQLYVTVGKRVSLYADYSNAGGSLGMLLQKAFKQNGSPLIVLFDVVEQQYRRESIPKVGYFDKNKVIRRRLLMAFAQQQFRAFIPLAQKPKENESLVALFAGLSFSPAITQVIDAVLASEVSVQGTGLLPMESTKLVAKLVEATHKRAKTPDDTRWSILMTHHKTGGLRQVIIKDGELALTRLTPLAVDAYDTKALTDEMVREFNATLTYLSRFGYVPGDGLDLIVVSAPQVAQLLREYRLTVTHLYALSTQEAGKLIGLTPVISEQESVFGEIIHAGWVGTQRKLLMPLSSPLLDKVTQARQFARVAILVLFLGAGYLAWQSFTLQAQVMDLDTDVGEQKAQRASLQNEYDNLAKKLNTLKYDVEKTRISLGIHDDYKKKSIDAEPMLTALNGLIDKSRMRLQKVDVQATVETIDPSAPPPPVGGDAAVTALIKPKAVINAVIGFAESVSLEEAAQATNDLADTLRKRFPGRAVDITQMAGNLSVDQTVQGISEQVLGNDDRSVQQVTSSIRITGALE